MFCYDIKLILRKYLWVLYSVIKPEYSVSSALLRVEKGTTVDALVVVQGGEVKNATTGW